MAEIKKMTSIQVMLDEMSTAISSLDDLAKIKMREQKVGLSPEEGKMDFGWLLLNNFQPDLQLDITSSFSLRADKDNFYDRDYLAVSTKSVSLNSRQLGADEIHQGPVLSTTLSEVGKEKSVADFVRPFAAVESKAMVTGQDNNGAELTRQLAVAEDETLAVQEDEDSELKKESPSAIKRDSTLVDKSTDTSGGGDFALTEQESLSGETQEAQKPPQHDNVMEQQYELPSEIGAEELDSLEAAKPIGSGKLTYNFGLWGEGHHVDVKLHQQDQDSHLQFEPSDSLVEQRMAEQWEHGDTPSHWSLLEDSSERQQGRQQREQAEPDDEAVL
ncbi:SpaN/EivJ family type III secretion system needle length determinant [Serratia liquefaciens]|uniref:SpaN/EivJ family type III secretion system needle length determinant n=1 Tax=Serratia liquefaciens TaxID=614 RepID=UPI002157EA87|nr:type III secretion system needle length determinant, SpaN/EivJ family [Serratia liquefaciens]